MSIQPNHGLRLNEAKLPDGMLRYHVFGSGRISIVIEMGLAASAGEWWHIAEHLAGRETALLYERMRETTPKRTPQKRGAGRTAWNRALS